MINGIDPAVSAALAARVDALFNGLTGVAAAPAASGATAQADAAQATAAQAQGAATASLLAAQDAPAQASTQTALSTVARTLDLMARLAGDANPPPLTGRAPLLASAPSASLAGQPMPGLASALHASLLDSLTHSGVFYESHLGQMLVGARSPADLAREPQAALNLLDVLGAGGAQGEAGGAGAAGAGAAGAGAAGASAAGAGAGAGAGAADASAHADGASGAGAAATQAGGPDGTGATGAARSDGRAQGLPHDAAGATGATPVHPGLRPATDSLQTTAAASLHGAGAALASAVHPAALPIVRQQLAMLDDPQARFRWQGEAWPGAGLQWEVEPDPAERGGAAPATPTWRTRLSLELPVLGRVDADLSLTGHRLTARLSAPSSGAGALAAATADLRRGVAAAGLDLQALNIADANAGTHPGTDHETGAQAPAEAARPVPAPDRAGR